MAKSKKPTKKAAAKKPAAEKKPAAGKKPAARRAPPPPIGRFSTPPGFAVVGDGNWVVPGDAMILYVLLERELEEKQRTAFLAGVPRLLRHALAWHGPLLRLGTPLERSYASENKAATLVRKEFGPSRTAKLSRAAERELAGDDFDPKVLPAAREAMADYGDAAPWARFYDALHAWLVAAHARQPIRLFLRKVVSRDGLTDLHRQGVDALFTMDLSAVASSLEKWVGGFLQELGVHAASSAPDEKRAAALLPILGHVWGTDAVAAAGLALVSALSPAHRAAFFDGLEPKRALDWLLRDDYLPALAKLPAFGERVTGAFARFWRADPTPEAIDGVAFRIQYALFPALRADAGIFELLAGEVAAHRDRYGTKRFATMPDSLAKDGHAAPAERFRRAIA
jgi:hypothetical protein